MDEQQGLEHRRYLFAIAYRMLGTVQEAEDAVQEAYLRWTQADRAEIENARAYLSTLVTRIAIDRLRSASRQRETYVGPWLPEPLVVDEDADPARAAETADTLSMAFLVVLESLGPVERAVFLLRGVFGYEHREIAHVVERSEAAVRQIAHRAREAVEARRPRFHVPPEQRRAVVERFLHAFRDADIDTMLELLAEDVTMRSDGGGKAHAARKPVVGAERVASFLLGVARLAPPNVQPEMTELNGQPALVVWGEDRALSTLIFEVRDGAIDEIFAVVNPDKLKRLQP